MIQLLPENRWHEIEPVLKEEFDAALPFRGKSTIVADIGEGGEIRSFIVAEYLLRVGQVWAKEGTPRGLFRYLEDNIENTSVIVVASDERFKGLCEKMQMREMPGTVYRRDF